MEDGILERILLTTYTIESFKRRVKALKSMLSDHFFGGKTNPLLENEEKVWLSSVGVSLFSMFSKETFSEKFNRLEKYADEIKPLTVYLAFDAGFESVEQIGSWVRDNISREIVMDVKMDKELIGGCAFIWNGVYRDYSIRAKIEGNKQQITTSFKQFLGSK